MPLDGPTARLAPAGAALLGALVLAGPAHAAPKLFPTDADTVRDKAQVTGRRVHLPLPDCGTRPSDCDDVGLENRLDGFDVDPRIAVRFDRPISVGDVSRRTLYLQRAAGGRRIALNRLVYDAPTRTLAARPTRQLTQATRYRLVVRLGRQRASTTFTTMSTTAQTAALAALPQRHPSVLKVADRFPAADITALRLHADTGTGFVDSVVPDLSRPAGGTYA